MAITGRHAASATLAFCLAVGGAVAVPIVFVLPIIGALAFGVREPVWFIAIFGVVLIGALLLPAGAVITGHVSLRRHPGDQRARSALIIGYCVLGPIGALVIVAVVTWLSIH